MRIDIDTLSKETIKIDGKPICEIENFEDFDKDYFLILALHLAGVDVYFDGESLVELSGLELTGMIKPESGE
jgi:hypothetical protein